MRTEVDIFHLLCGRKEVQNGRSDPYADGTGKKSPIHKWPFGSDIAQHYISSVLDDAADAPGVLSFTLQTCLRLYIDLILSIRLVSSS